MRSSLSARVIQSRDFRASLPLAARALTGQCFSEASNGTAIPDQNLLGAVLCAAAKSDQVPVVHARQRTDVRRKAAAGIGRLQRRRRGITKTRPCHQVWTSLLS